MESSATDGAARSMSMPNRCSNQNLQTSAGKIG